MFVKNENPVVDSENIITSQIAMDGISQSETSGWGQTAKRVAMVAIPFISLYRPAGKALSLGFGALRSVSEVSTFGISVWNGEKLKAGKAFLGTALAVTALATTVFSFTLGTLVLTLTDLSTHLLNSARHLAKREWKEAFSALVQTALSSLYLASMAVGGFELVLAILVFQAILELIRSEVEFRKGNFLEATAHMLMAFVRIYQALPYAAFLKAKRDFISDPKFNNIRTRISQGKGSAIATSVFADPKRTYKENRFVIVGADDKELDFGANLHGFGKGLVKGQNLQLRVKEVEGVEVTELQFKVNHVFREKIEEILKEYEGMSPEDLTKALFFSGVSTGMRIDTEHYLPDNEIAELYEISDEFRAISVAGLGALRIGSHPGFVSKYNEVTVLVAGGGEGEKLQMLLSLFGMSDALQLSSAEDIERMQLGALFRAYFPREALPLERSEEFFTYSLATLKDEMIARVPDMKEHIENELPNMIPYTILPGRYRWGSEELAEQAYNAGARALLMGTSADSKRVQAGYDVIASILRGGPLSIEMREYIGMTLGIPTAAAVNYASGGSDSVYAHLITEQDMAGEGARLEKYLFCEGGVRLLFNLSILGSGTQQFFFDNYGMRALKENDVFQLYEEMHDFLREMGLFHLADKMASQSYENRPSILEFIRGLDLGDNELRILFSKILKQMDVPSNYMGIVLDNVMDSFGNFNGSNEVMMKDRLLPSYIMGLVVDDEEKKTGLIDYLKEKEITQINGKPLHEMVHIASHLTEKIAEDCKPRRVEEITADEALKMHHQSLFARMRNLFDWIASWENRTTLSKLWSLAAS